MEFVGYVLDGWFESYHITLSGLHMINFVLALALLLHCSEFLFFFYLKKDLLLKHHLPIRLSS